MQIKKDFDYYHNLHNVITHALLHLLCRVATSSRFVPVPARNETLIKFLKPKLTDKSLSNIKKDLKLMINVARKNAEPRNQNRLYCASELNLCASLCK